MISTVGRRRSRRVVLAEALGIHANTAMRYATVAGTNYLPYAAPSPPVSGRLDRLLLHQQRAFAPASQGTWRSSVTPPGRGATRAEVTGGVPSSVLKWR
jgi:hypothetical protein